MKSNRWHFRLLALADEYGFRPRVCRHYSAKTKGKVERFNGYLKGSFITPLAATLKSAGFPLNVATANAYIGRWVNEVAHQRIHGTAGVKLKELRQWAILAVLLYYGLRDMEAALLRVGYIQERRRQTRADPRQGGKLRSLPPCTR